MGSPEQGSQTAHPLDTAIRVVKEWRETAHPDALFISSGSLQNTSIPRPTGFHDRDTKGNMAWGKSRAVAAATLTEMFPSAPVLTLSRSSFEEPGPSDAAGMSQEIRKLLRLDLPITELPMPRDTFSELLETVYTSLGHDWQSPVFVTTVFQEPRARVMLESIMNNDEPSERQKINQIMEYNEKRYKNVPGFANHFREALDAITAQSDRVKQITVDLIPAEATFLMRSHLYSGVITALRKDEDYNKQIQKNMDGVIQWQSGLYGK